MDKLTDIDLVRCVLIGNEDSGMETMLKKYAAFTGVPYNAERRELVTAFNGRKCVFVARTSTDKKIEKAHVFLVCVSVASQECAEDTVNMILDTVIKRFRDVPYVLVGTNIDTRLSMLIENYGCGENNYRPMALNQAESFAKRIGACKYMECSELTGEGLDEVFEGAFEIGHCWALETKRNERLRRKITQLQENEERKLSCITQ